MPLPKILQKGKLLKVPPKPPVKKRWLLPGAAGFRASLPELPPFRRLQVTTYLDRLEELLALYDKLGTISTREAYDIYQNEIAGIGQVKGDLSKLPSAYIGLASLTPMAWQQRITAFAEPFDLKEKAIAQYQREQTELENQRISGEQERQARVVQFGQQQQEARTSAQLADVKQWTTLMGSNQGQGTGVLGAFNMAGLETGRWQKQQLMGAFENWRRESLGRLTGSGNWIRRWEIQHMPNPYFEEEPTPLGEASEIVGRLDTEIERLESIAQYYPPGSAPSGSELDQLIQAVPVALDNLKSQRAEWQATKERLLGEPWSDFRPQAEPWQQTPPAPAKLSELVPSLQTGQPIRKGVTVPTPSMQQWGRMLPSEQDMFGGFLDWAQGSGAWEDIIAKTKQMLPESPNLGGRGSWSPARQGR